MTAPPIDRLPVPTSAVELEDLLSDKSKIDAMIASGQFTEVIQNYARIINDKDTGIKQQITDEVQRVTAEWLKEYGHDKLTRPNLTAAVDGIKATNGRSSLYGRTAPGVELDNIFDSMAEFMGATHHRARDTAKMPGLMAKRGKLEQVQNAFGSTVPPDGGFLIPEVMRSELLRVSLETAIVRPRARTIPMDSLLVPFPMIDSTSNATNVYGGLTAYWTDEGAALTQSSAKFGRIVLQAKKLTAYSEVPNELFADSLISLEAFINQAFPEALAWFEDVAFFRGNGVGEPQGFFNSPAIISVAKETGQAAATIVWENLVKMFSRMLPTSIGRAVWIAHIDTFPQLATMALSVGTGGVPVWLTNGADSAPMNILGRPVIFTEKASTVGTLGDISFVDFGYYLIGDRQVMHSESSPHYKFANDQTAIRFIERIDGRPWLQSAITPNQGSNTMSPFVQVATRS
jgi:HK97 family phage major capsid protein